jgi:hypothetical protein
MNPWLRKRGNKKFLRLDMKVSRAPAIVKKRQQKIFSNHVVERGYRKF